MSSKKRVPLVIAAVLSAAILTDVDLPTVLAQSCRSNPRPPEGAASWRGRYVNIEYQYEVAIPPGLVGFSSPEPSPQHGFGMTLGGADEGYLWVDGFRNSGGHTSAREAADEFLLHLKSRGATIAEVKHQPVSVGRRSADRMRVRYRCPGNAGDLVSDYVALLGPGRSIEWTLALDTPATRYAEDTKVLDAIVRSWKFRPSSR